MIGDELSKICKTISDVDLTCYNTFKLHSKASFMVFPNDIESLKAVIKVLKKYKTKWFIIGNGSNIILPDYYDGVIIKLDNFNKYEIQDDLINVGAGVMINKLATKLAKMGYKGLDFACGIPGTIGGCIHSNAGSYGSSISDVLVSATVFDGNKIIEFSNKDFKFAYRDSILKNKSNYIVLDAKFKIFKSDKEELEKTIKERNTKRRISQDLTHPSNGSVFRNPEGLIAGKMIDDLGMKGYSINDASISTKHANFIINKGNANSDDIIKLIKVIKKEVKKHYNVDLILEQEIIK